MENKNWKALVISTIVVFSMLAMAQTAVSQPPAITVKGIVTYTENGTYVPDGWTVSISVDAKNYSADGEPWNGTTGFQWPMWNYSIAAGANVGDVVRATVNSPDMAYIGTNTAVCTGSGSMYINVTVSAGPAITVVYPNGGEEIAIGTSVDVSADVSSGSAVTSVVFEYSNDNGGSWNAIGSGTLVSGTATDGTWNATWDTLGLPVGDEYQIKANATDSVGLSVEDQSDSTFSLVDRTKPIVINGSANPSTIAINTSFTELRVDVADRDSEIDNVTIDLSPIGGKESTKMFNIGNYSQGGLLWTMYNYTTNSSVEGTFNLTVNATDIYENYNDTVDIMLTVVQAIQQYNITIYNGWNLISIPLEPQNKTLSYVIVGAVDYDTVYRWVPGEGYKSAYYGGGDWWGQPSEVEPIEPGVGYWYDRKGAEFNLTIEGEPLTGTIVTPIYTGWNLVGYASLQETNLSVINAPVDYDTIYRWVPGEGYKSAYYGGGYWWGQPSEVEPIEPGVGYWYDRKGADYNWTYIT
jgi:hypothetical protein